VAVLRKRGLLRRQPVSTDCYDWRLPRTEFFDGKWTE